MHSICFYLYEKCTITEDLPRVLGNKGTQSFISREQGIFNFALKGIAIKGITVQKKLRGNNRTQVQKVKFSLGIKGNMQAVWEALIFNNLTMISEL